MSTKIDLRNRCSHQKSHICLVSHRFPTPALDTVVSVIYLSEELWSAFFLSSAGWWQNVSGQTESPDVSGLHPGPETYWWPNKTRQKLKLPAVSKRSSHPRICWHAGEADGVRPTNSRIITALISIRASTVHVNQVTNITQVFLLTSKTLLKYKAWKSQIKSC